MLINRCLKCSVGHLLSTGSSVAAYRSGISVGVIRRLCVSAYQNQVNLDEEEPVGVGTGKKARLNVELDDKADEVIKTKNLHPKNHPGVFSLSKVYLPEKFISAAERLLNHENTSQISKRGKLLYNHLWSRHLPVEEHEYRAIVTDVEGRIKLKDDFLKPFLSQEQLNRLEENRDQKILLRLKKRVYHWEPMEYNWSRALEYLVARSAGEYSVLRRIFDEIQRRDKSFQPNSLLDFGSGIGTVVWASRNVWPSLREFLCADVSRDMNDLAELILRGGNQQNDHGIPGLYFRQFLPQSSTIQYDMVVSAYSLMEMESVKKRLEIIDILWKKTKDYLVIVEQGTNAGFQAIMEARDYVLQLNNPKYKVKDGSHVFSPCPNDKVCPRYEKDTIPCNFNMKYRPLYPFHKEATETEVFSYVVLRKGSRDPLEERWPRLVQDPMVRKRHVICRVCTKEGNLSEVVLTKNTHSQMLYRIGRKSSCGDLLPVKEIDETNQGESVHEEKRGIRTWLKKRAQEEEK